MKIAICDDEEKIIDEVMITVDSIISEYGYVGEYDSFIDGTELITKCIEEKTHYDIYILDILMDSINGIDLAKKIRNIDRDGIIIFLTSFKNWMAEAFDVQAFHYIMKPIEKIKIQQVFRKCMDYLQDRKILYAFKQGKKITTVFYKNIYYFESDKRKVIIHTNEANFEYYDTIASVQNKIGEELFTRTHASYFVNMDHIRSFDGKDILLDNGMQIPVSKKYINVFNKNFMQYIKKRS